jgi:alpha-mannosidase
MHDEASPFYTEMVDQTTRGHQFLKKNFGASAVPRGTWQIDPFGHSNTVRARRSALSAAKRSQRSPQ